DYKLGKYCVFLEELDEIISKLEIIDIKYIDVIVIDEIGKMELYSRKFQDYLNKIFSIEVAILATIGLNLNHPIKDYILNLENITIFNLNQRNFHKTYLQVISKI
ncbi:MAG: nucleoside-triphosphatase, partial [Promethearchaeota archaeon]